MPSTDYELCGTNVSNYNNERFNLFGCLFQLRDDNEYIRFGKSRLYQVLNNSTQLVTDYSFQITDIIGVKLDE